MANMDMALQCDPLCMPIGPIEIILVLVILLVLFGARQLPKLGKGLG